MNNFGSSQPISNVFFYISETHTISRTSSPSLNYRMLLTRGALGHRGGMPSTAVRPQTHLLHLADQHRRHRRALMQWLPAKQSIINYGIVNQLSIDSSTTVLVQIYSHYVYTTKLRITSRLITIPEPTTTKDMGKEYCSVIQYKKDRGGEGRDIEEYGKCE